MPVITTEQEIDKLIALTDELKIRLKAEKAAKEVRIVVFASKKELAEALSNDRTFMTLGGRHLWYDKTCAGSPFRSWDSPIRKNNLNGTTMDYSWDAFSELEETTIEDTPWYLIDSNFPLKCYVSDSGTSPHYGDLLITINSYKADIGCPFRGATSWKYATPLKNSQKDN